MPTVETLIPKAGQADAEGLRAFDADGLAEYVADPAHPWWRRRPCVLALAGRVPEHRVAGLIARVHDPRDVAEVRIALLDLLADRTELLPWLGHPDRRQEGSYGMPEAILKARGLLGDRSAAGALTTLAASPWRRWRAVGEAGLDALVARYGAGAVLSDVGDARPEVRGALAAVHPGQGGEEVVLGLGHAAAGRLGDGRGGPHVDHRVHAVAEPQLEAGAELVPQRGGDLRPAARRHDEVHAVVETARRR